MRRRKVYGQSRVDKCPFCGKQAVSKNSQGVPVCIKHTKNMLLDLKCICGELLDVMNGKFGAYFRCMRCGNVSFSKAMEANPDLGKTETPVEKEIAKTISKAKPKSAPKEIVVTSDDIDLYYS